MLFIQPQDLPCFYCSDQGVTDHEEPDLAAYTTINMSTLRDVRRTGMDYVLSMEALMHTTPGLKPGYLPEHDAHYLLSGVSIFEHWRCWQSSNSFILFHTYIVVN